MVESVRAIIEKIFNVILCSRDCRTNIRSKQIIKGFNRIRECSISSIHPSYSIVGRVVTIGFREIMSMGVVDNAQQFYLGEFRLWRRSASSSVC